MGILSAFGLLVFYSPIFLGWITHDISPIDDSDLLLGKISILEQGNGYFDLVKAVANLKSIIDEHERNLELFDMVEGKTWDEKLADELLSQNQATLDHFHAAMQRPAFQNPAFSNPEEISFKTKSFVNAFSIMDLSKLETLYLLSLTKKRLHHEAINQSLQLMKFGQKMQDSVTSLLFYMVGSSLKQQGINIIQQTILSNSTPVEDLQSYIQSLEPFYDNERGLINAMKFEYALFKNLFKNPKNINERNILIKDNKSFLKKWFKKGDPRSRTIEIGYYFRPNKTLQMKAENTRAIIEKISLPCGDLADIPQPTQKSRVIMYFTENIMGKLMVEMVSLDLVRHIEKRCEEDWLLATTQSLMAIQAYKLEKGDYPKTLEDLSPTYLPHPPIDPYDGQVLKYDLEKKIIYSASKDKNLKYSFDQL